jgi:hypothetical protein
MDPVSPAVPSHPHIPIGTSERADGSYGQSETLAAECTASGSVRASYPQNPERLKNFNLLIFFHCRQVFQHSILPKYSY